MRSAMTLMVAAFLAIAPALRADDGWALTTADLKRQNVGLKNFTEKGVEIVAAGATEAVIIPLDRFLQLDRGAANAAASGAWILHLITGDKVGGEPASIANDILTWSSPAIGKIEIPLKEIRGLAKGQAPVRFDTDRTEDAIYFQNGDILKGIVTGMENGKLQMKQASGDVIPIDLANATSVHLAAAGKPESSNQRLFRVQLADGSVIAAKSLRVTDQQIQLTLARATGAATRTVDLAQVTLIEQLNGPVSWLSVRMPDQTEYAPMFDIAFPPQMDRNYRGEKIRAGGREFGRGIGVHAMCRLTWNLDGSYKFFRTQYALNEDAFKGRVTVRILLDDKVIHEARDVTLGKLAPVFVHELGSARKLILEAHPGGDPSSPDRAKWAVDTQARLNWIEPALLFEKPTPEPAPILPKPSPTPATLPTTAPSTRPVTRPATAPFDPTIRSTTRPG